MAQPPHTGGERRHCTGFTGSWIYHWVGTGRVALRYVSPCPPLDPYVRLSPHTAHERRILRERSDRKSTRLNSSHGYISYAVFCLKKKKKTSLELTQMNNSEVYDQRADLMNRVIDNS